MAVKVSIGMLPLSSSSSWAAAAALASANCDVRSSQCAADDAMLSLFVR